MSMSDPRFAFFSWRSMWSPIPMTEEHAEIPVIGRLESAGIGLLQARPPADSDHRLEDWIASNLDAQADGLNENHWNSLIRNLPTCPTRSSTHRGPEGKHSETASDWSRFHLVYRRGITVVRLVDRNLIQQANIEELGLDLMDLIAVGNHRLVLNFTAVERLGSWIIGVVGNAHRACALADGGRLKLCGLDAQLAEIFEIVGMARDLEFHPGESEAIESPWPVSAAARPLPIDILNVLLDLGELPPVRGGAPARTEHASPPRQAASLPALQVALRVQSGSGEPRLVRVPATGFVIGREGNCPFRIGSALVSKRHAALEQRDGKVYLRDLGSTNGTVVNGQILRGQEQELFDGDQIQVGPVISSLVIAVPDAASDPLEVMPQEIVTPDEPAAVSLPDEPTVQDIPAYDESDPEHRIRFEVIEDVLVVTPQFEHLSGEETLAALRARLQALFESDLPRRLVVNLEFVSHVSRQAIALLLSHHIRLDWAGGGLRICQAHARIVALLDQVRLTMLVDCYPTLDEAVLASWTSMRSTAGQA
jgi:anti-anti-sigma regulatory factor